ncbi:MAG: endonuclease III [Ancrocorticia sp.]|jgi:endonuclease-3|nr:endonuclease III [Ancrocorticia sp.]MCI1896057.1 endonuclease III [Ancrocorticia sp.]MCI1932693.1 endonuclease III [Ancrocorticia sp.]MCI1963781.1 endonuclease III [Ancrocorticia sp.]MCI2002119.1 endonuclease III [Ancrocorticia sp.]
MSSPQNNSKKTKAAQARLPRRPRSLAARREQARAITDRLALLYPDAHCALLFRNPFQLLVATVLSAQTTDVRVNSVTPELFRRYPDPEAMAGAAREDLEEILHPLGFFRAKAKSCHGLAAALCDRFGGEVPASLEELVTLPGVGRKTANVVLGNSFGIPGITVDTHVGRLSRRWGWTRQADPVKAERDIAALLPPEIWTQTCHRIIDHGRKVCHSRKPACIGCGLADLCPSYELFVGVPAPALPGPMPGASMQETEETSKKETQESRG